MTAQRLLASIGDSAVGAVILDPPDAIGINTSQNENDTPLDETISKIYPIAEESVRILRPGGATIVLGSPHIMSAWEVAASWAGLRPVAELTVLWHGEKVSKVHGEVASFSMSVRWHTKPGYRFAPRGRLTIESNVIVCNEVPFPARYLTTQRPIELFNFLISLFTDHSDVVVDPFCGSGSALVAAEICGRDWIGGDINPSLCAIATRRVGHHEVEASDLNPIYYWIRSKLVPI